MPAPPPTRSDLLLDLLRELLQADPGFRPVVLLALEQTKDER